MKKIGYTNDFQIKYAKEIEGEGLFFHDKHKQSPKPVYVFNIWTVVFFIALLVIVSLPLSLILFLALGAH